MSARRRAATVSPDTVTSAPNKKSRVGNALPIPNMEDIYEALEYAPLNEVVEKLAALEKYLDKVSSIGLDILKTTICAPRTKVSAAGNTWTGSLVHCWANDHYDLDEVYYHDDQKTWLRNMTEEQKSKDALLSPDLLLSHGADIHAKDCFGQTPLHLAMTNGLEYVVQALLKRVSYTLEHLNQVDNEKDNPFSCALSNGQYECAKVFLDYIPLETAVYIEDGEGNNMIAVLCQYCNVNYHANDFEAEDLDDPSLTLNLFRKVLQVVEKQEMVDVLLHTNQYDENCLHVAARCGNFLEIQEILKLTFGCGRSVANCYLNGNTPLDRICKTRDLVLSQAPIEVFEKQFAIYGFEEPIARDRELKNWLHNSINRAIELLERDQEGKPVSLEKALGYRPGARAGGTQILSEAAKQLKAKYCPKQRPGMQVSCIS